MTGVKQRGGERISRKHNMQHDSHLQPWTVDSIKKEFQRLRRGKIAER